MSTFTVAGLQLALGNHQDNFATIRQQVILAKKRFPHLDMVLLPELCTFGSAPRFAQPMPGAAEQRYCELAAELGIWLLPGSLYERDGEAIYNTAPAINPDGEVVARYRKMFPFLPYETGVSSGRECVSFEVPGVARFGIAICYDMWFPEVCRTLAWQGAEVVLHPTLTNTIDRDAELALSRANATMNQIYMVDINAAGELGVGQSIVAGPGGEVLHQASTHHEVILVELDLAYLRRCREQGWHGLGQPLKSFRDHPLAYPPYQSGARSEALDQLGPLAKPKGRNWNHTD
ncbi:carbon-nitrogen hydrolase family protein [Ferrimonas balearica]|uniref:carbon-nitrogen hydrolase family protein n=1 Tax=Ferrimonas balearica TaxID=44012 RepID=UPI001C9955E2|nr:carbon-nitrogen hydrolase family protein [Ferrimonas balearica]MBY5992213.1 carbon-nitrogen hydrolase family protein [Ferrimonas balearica]